MSLRRAWDFGFIHDHALRKASERATQIEESDGPERVWLQARLRLS
jgi:hypothetical protein